MTYRRQDRWGYGETRWSSLTGMIIGLASLGGFLYVVAHFVWKYW